MLPKFAITRIGFLRKLALFMAGAALVEALIWSKESRVIVLVATILGVGIGVAQYYFLLFVLRRRENLLIPPWFPKVFGRLAFFGGLFTVAYLPIVAPLARGDEFQIELLPCTVLSGIGWLFAAIEAHKRLGESDESA